MTKLIDAIGQIDAETSNMTRAERISYGARTGLARHEYLRLLTLSISLHQLILCSGAFFLSVAFDRLALPPACRVEDYGHCDVEEAEAELCCGHDVPLSHCCVEYP